MEKEIEQALRNYLDAFNAMKWQELEGFLVDDFTYFTDTCIRQNKSEYMKFMSTNPWCSKDYTIDNLKVITGITPDIAIACYDSAFEGTYKDKPARVEAIETTVFRKINNSWLLVHSHTRNK
jgi:ketosteroid isomerase-like protein